MRSPSVSSDGTPNSNLDRITGDGITDDTAAIQRAVDAGIARFPSPDPDLQRIVEEMAPADPMDAVDARGWMAIVTQWHGKCAHAAIQVDQPPHDRFYEAYGESFDEAVAAAYAIACAAEDS